jgi:hypothetical protein
MSLVNQSLVRAFRRLMKAFQATRKETGRRDRMRPMPDAVVEKYHRAIWALDMLGPMGSNDRRGLDELWRNATHVAEHASGPDGGAIAADIISTLNDQCERVIRECEKDPERPMWEKQRDFLVGSLRRVRRAAMLNDIEHLHYYKKQDQVFSIDMKHPDFQVGYDLWQGLVVELKEAVTRSLYNNKPNHLRVEYLLTECRKLIWALEAGDVSKLNHYERSPLHLSKEEEGRILWEGVREHAAKVIAQSGAA